MNYWKLLYPILSVTLLAGLAHLRSGWLGAAEEHVEPTRAVTAAYWAARQTETSAVHSFLRQR